MLSLLRGTDIRLAIHTFSHDLQDDTDQVNEIKSTVDDIYVFHLSPHFMASFISPSSLLTTMKLNFVLYWSNFQLSEFTACSPMGSRFMDHFGSKIGSIELLPPTTVEELLWHSLSRPLEVEREFPPGIPSSSS